MGTFVHDLRRTMLSFQIVIVIEALRDTCVMTLLLMIVQGRI